MACKIPGEILNYLEIVEGGKVPVCKEQIQLAAMVRRVFQNEDIYVDTERLERYMEFQKFFPFRLFEWEEMCFTIHNCTFRTTTGLPRFPSLLIMVGRGAGKNGYMSFEDFCLLTPVHGVRNYDIDVCATSEEQAKMSFEEIRLDVLENPEHRKEMEKYFYWTKEVIMNRRTQSKMKFRTNNAKSKDGLRSGKVDFDEYHQYEDYDNINVFTGGLGKKPHPRRTYATTDGFVRGGPLDDLKDRVQGILSGGISDNGLFPFVCKLDDEKEAEDPDLWVKANPSLPYRIDLYEQMKQEWVECEKNPSLYSAFLTKRMNIPIGDRDSDVAEWEELLECNRPLPDLTGQSCVGGVDFARTNDFIAVGLLFKDGDIRYWLTHTFVCRQSADLQRIKAPLKEWARQGQITFVDDVCIHPDVVVNWFAEKALTYEITHIAIDSFRYSVLSSALEENGFEAKGSRKNIKLVRPSDQMLVEPVINDCFKRRLIAWGEDNRLMCWYANNTKKKISQHGNFTYEKKEEKSRKTDGFMALVAAMTLENEVKAPLPPIPDWDVFVY